MLLCCLSPSTLAQPPVNISTVPDAAPVRANVLFVDEQVVTRPVIQEMMAAFRTFFLQSPENAPEILGVTRFTTTSRSDAVLRGCLSGIHSMADAKIQRHSP